MPSEQRATAGPHDHDEARPAPLRPAGQPVEALLRRAQFFIPGGTPGLVSEPVKW